MAEISVIEGAHRTNIERLIDEFGEDWRGEILDLYTTHRTEEENNARINDFTPIFVYRAVKEALVERNQGLASP